MMKFIITNSLRITLLMFGLAIQLKCFGQTINHLDAPPSPTPSKNVTSIKTAQYLLQTSTLLYEQKNIAAAKNILNTIDTSSLTPELEQTYVLQQAMLAIASNDSNAATTWLNEDILTEIPISDIKKQIAFHELRAKTFLLKNQFINCADEYTKIISLLPKTNRQPYIDSLWSALSKAENEALRNKLSKKPSQDLYNWIELSLIQKDTSINSEEKNSNLKKWLSTHPDHPIPSDLFEKQHN